MLADAVGSVGVLIAGGLVLVFGWTSPTSSSASSFRCGWSLARCDSAAASLRILTQASPAHLDVEALRLDLAALPGVCGVHDLHVWTLTTGMDVATVHLVSDHDPQVRSSTRRAPPCRRTGLEHATVQVEGTVNGRRCEQDVTW